MVLNVMAIKKILARKQMSQADLSARSGMTRQSINLILSRGTCSIKSAGKLSMGLGVELDEILAET